MTDTPDDRSGPELPQSVMAAEVDSAEMVALIEDLITAWIHERRRFLIRARTVLGTVFVVGVASLATVVSFSRPTTLTEPLLWFAITVFVVIVLGYYLTARAMRVASRTLDEISQVLRVRMRGRMG